MFSNKIKDRLLSYSKNEIPPIPVFIKNKNTGKYIYEEKMLVEKKDKYFIVKNEMIKQEEVSLFIEKKENGNLCPYCQISGFEDLEFIKHWALFHGNVNEKLKCPICSKKGDDQVKGDSTWGFSNHLLVEHEYEKPLKKETFYGFSLVICQHPKTKKFILIQEGSQSGWWIPAGRVDPGEDFIDAAKRESLEEAGIEIELKGILGFEFTPHNGYVRQRMIFYAHPKNLNDPLKSIPDYESLRAVWISYKEMMDALKKNEIHLRGNEPLYWFKYVEDNGVIYDLKLLK